jgi:uncharacterized protein with PIN domain
MIVTKNGNTMKYAKCPNCNCEFLYSQKDINISYNRINAYESEFEYEYVCCPECKREIKLTYK